MKLKNGCFLIVLVWIVTAELSHPSNDTENGIGILFLPWEFCFSRLCLSQPAGVVPKFLAQPWWEGILLLERSQLHVELWNFVGILDISHHYPLFPLKIRGITQKFQVPRSLEIPRNSIPMKSSRNTWLFLNSLVLWKHFELFRMKIMEFLRLEKSEDFPGKAGNSWCWGWSWEVEVAPKSWIWCHLWFLTINYSFYLWVVLWDEGWDPDFKSTGWKIVAFFFKTVANTQNRNIKCSLMPS